MRDAAEGDGARVLSGGHARGTRQYCRDGIHRARQWPVVRKQADRQVKGDSEVSRLDSLRRSVTITMFSSPDNITVIKRLGCF